MPRETRVVEKRSALEEECPRWSEYFHIRLSGGWGWQGHGIRECQCSVPVRTLTDSGFCYLSIDRNVS